MNPKRILAMLVILLMVISMISACGNSEITATLSQTKLELAPGATSLLSVSIENSDDTPFGIVWESSNESVATVDSGKITAINSGAALIKANVTIYKNDGTVTQTLTCTVTVSGDNTIDGIYFEESDYSAVPGDTFTLEVKFIPETASAPLTWSSSDEDIATVDENGTVTVHKEGEAVIKVSASDTFYTTCNIICSNKDEEEQTTSGKEQETTTKKASHLKLNTTDTTIYVGDSETLKASGNSGKLTWKSSNSSVVTVSGSGKITGLKAGSAKVTVSDGTNSVVCDVYVRNRKTTQKTQEKTTKATEKKTTAPTEKTTADPGEAEPKD